MTHKTRASFDHKATPVTGSQVCTMGRIGPSKKGVARGEVCRDHGVSRNTMSSEQA
jgi:hypothetical protein